MLPWQPRGSWAGQQLRGGTQPACLVGGEGSSTWCPLSRDTERLTKGRRWSFLLDVKMRGSQGRGPHTLGTLESPRGPAAGPQPIVSDSVGLGQGLIIRISKRLQMVPRKDTQRTQRAEGNQEAGGRPHLRASSILVVVNYRNGVWRETGFRDSEGSLRSGVASPWGWGCSDPGLCCRFSSQPFSRSDPHPEGEPLEALLTPLS